MKTVMTFKFRKDAEDAADFLMSRGIPSNIKGVDITPPELEMFKRDSIVLVVQDKYLSKSAELLYKRTIGFTLPPINIKLPWKKKQP